MIISARNTIEIEKCFKVEAGPGAGKTEFLINHMRNVLQHSKRMACTRKIACITYTNAAVDTIITRLGRNASDRVEVSTIHSFLYRNIVKPYCFSIPDEYELCCNKVNGHEEFYINNKHIREWFDNEDMSVLKHPNTVKQLLCLPLLNQALQNWIMSIKCKIGNGIIGFECDNTKAVAYDGEDGSSIRISAKNLGLLAAKLLGLKKTYWRRGRLDHEDIMFFACILIEKYPFILDVIRAKYPYIFIDEYQDTNPIQSKIIDEIRKRETVIGVIGDKAQSIYSFQGAEPLLFDRFCVERESEFTINDNRRSTNQIVKLLNDVRNDIHQEACCNTDDIEVVMYVGDKGIAYSKACEVCGGRVQTLSRDNITSNSMKKNIQGNQNCKRLLFQYESSDSSGERRTFILYFIRAIELAINTRYGEALETIETLFRRDTYPRKTALVSLVTMVNSYEEFCNDTLMKFYDVICDKLPIKLPTFRAGAAKDFYNQNRYTDIAICVNIAEDASEHITIHKAKGVEYENVLVIGSKKTIEFLRAPNLNENEEHRVLYVAISRAMRKLFMHIDGLSKTELAEISEKYNYINVQRL